MALDKLFNDIASKSDENDINLSPMIDMIFLLLLFFMVTTTFEKNAGIEIKKSDAESAAIIKKERVTVAIDSLGSYWIEDEALPLKKVISSLESWHSGNKEGVILIVPDRNVKMDSFIQLVDELNTRSISNFAIGTNPPSRKKT